MPTINKLPKREKSNTRNENTDMRSLRKTAYNTTAWRKLRNTYIHNHPVCESCIKKGRVTPAVDIHHIESPFKGGKINYTKLLDENNLMALCKECHSEIHAKQHGYITPEEMIRQLDILFDENNTVEDLETLL